MHLVYPAKSCINRGYYMATWRYKISLRVLKNISQVSTVNDWIIFSTREEKFHISKRSRNVLFNYINTNELPNHFTLIVFWCVMCNLLCGHSKGDIFTFEDNMLFSHVKISSFRANAYLVFHWCLYNKNCFQFLLGITVIPREIEDKGCAKFRGGGGGGG